MRLSPRDTTLSTDPGLSRIAWLLRKAVDRVPTQTAIAIVAAALYERWIADRAGRNDRAHLARVWDFSAPGEQERYARVLSAVTEVRGTANWGDVLEVGCAEGLFTLELVARARTVTAVDISAVACARAAARCARLPQVRVLQLDLETGTLPGRYDILFAMDVLERVHGRDRMGRIVDKLVTALREGGLLVVTSERLPPDAESARWARLLLEGGRNIARYLSGHRWLRVVHTELHPPDANVISGYRPHVIGLFERLAPEGAG